MCKRQKDHDRSQKMTCHERGKNIIFRRGGINIIFRPRYRPLADCAPDHGRLYCSSDNWTISGRQVTLIM